MTPIQETYRKLLDKQSQHRQRAGELAAVESLNSEQQAELRSIETATPNLEMQIRAARAAKAAEDEASVTTATDPGTLDPEKREKIQLRSRCRVGAYFADAVGHSRLDGAELEYRQAEGLGTKTIPLSLWEDDRPAETRADAPTPAPATVGNQMSPVMPYFFSQSVIPMLGVSMPAIESGSYSVPTITAQASGAAATKAKGGTIESVAPTVSVVTGTPKRISARVTFRQEDILAVGASNFEAAIRANMMQALNAELDNQGLNGNNTAPNLNGLIRQIPYSNTAPTQASDFDAWHAIFADLVDGNFATRLDQVKVALGVATYRKMISTFASADDSVSVMTALQGQLGGLWCNERMPAPASNLQDAIAIRSAHNTTRAICGHYGAIQIDDPYSDSAGATKHVTAHIFLTDILVVQTKAFAKLRFWST